MMNCPSNNARKFQNNADLCKDPREKHALYIQASKEYLKAADSVINDSSLQASLNYLSNTAVYKANLVQQLFQKSNTDVTGQLEQIDRNIGKSKVSGPISGVSEALHSQRVIYKSHQNRISAISKIPKAAEVSPSNAVRDLLLMESKLSELGIDKDDAYHEALVSAQHSILLNAPSSLGQSGVHLSSALGESFMVLKPAHQQHTQQTTRMAIEDHSRQNRVGHSPSGVLTAGRVETAVHSDRSEERVAAHRGGAVNRPGERLLPPPNEATWASTVMTWGGFAATGTPPVPPSPEEVPDDPHAAPAWNEQSVFSSSGSAGGGGTGSATRGESLMQSTISVDGSDMTRSTISVLNGEAQRNAQGVANLLQTVRRLGEENAQLAARVEHLKSEKDLQLIQMRSEISTFKQDYSEKFRRVKTALRDFSVSHRAATGEGMAEEDPALRGSLDASAALLQEAEDRLTRAREAVVEAEVKQSKEKRQRVITSVSDGPVAASSVSSGADAEKRQRDLERTVQALVGRLQKANDDNKRKDALLRAADPTYVSALGSSDGQSGSRPNSHRPSSSSSSGRSSQPPPLQHPSSQVSGNGNGIGGRGIAIPLSVSGSSHQMAAGRGSSGGISSPTPKKTPAAISRHPSTATLEALQKANK